MPAKGPFSKIDRIGIIAKATVANNSELLHGIFKIVSNNASKVFLCENCAKELKQKKGMSRADILSKSQLVIVMGGDGTLLSVTRAMPKRIVHILSINTGTLGFLTEVGPDHALDAVERIFKGNYGLDPRFLLRVTVYRDGQKIETHLALNDAVITQGAKARLIELPVAINQRQVNRYRADGLIIATPTGSTGHAMSAGGPIVHPKLNAIVLAPICPLSLANRPIVVPNDRQINITVETFRDQHESVSLTIDGQICVPMAYQDEVKIRRSSRKLYLVRLTGRNYYRKLRKKLNWGN